MGPTHIKISHSNLVHNYNLIKKKVDNSVKVMAMIKANAYGHGIIEVAKTLEKENIDYFGVAFPREGILLRDAGIKTPILVVGAHLNDSIKHHTDYNLDITITRFNQLKFLNTYCSENNKSAKICWNRFKHIIIKLIKFRSYFFNYSTFHTSCF